MLYKKNRGKYLYIKKQRGNFKMEVKYNVKYKFKTNKRKTNEELKNIFNRKLLNIIIALENQELLLNKS